MFKRSIEKIAADARESRRAANRAELRGNHALAAQLNEQARRDEDEVARHNEDKADEMKSAFNRDRVPTLA